MNILVYNDTISSPNFGCQLVSNSIRKCFKEVFPDYNIIYKDRSDFAKIKPLPDINLVWVNGEGCFGHKHKYPGGFDYLKKIIDTYSKKSIPIYLANASVQLNLDADLKYSCLEIIKKCSMVTVREPLSYEFLSEAGIKNLRLLPDIGCYYFKDEDNPEKNIDICFGFGALSKEIKDDNDKVKKYVALFNELSEEGYKIQLLGFPSNPKNDSEFLKAYGVSEKIEIIDNTFVEYFKSARRAKLNVTGRHHGCVMSFVGRTPFYSFESNMWKTEGDQLFYGPYDSFKLQSEISKDDLKRNILTNYENFGKHSYTLESRFNSLYPFFDGHVRVIKDSTINCY